MDQVRDWYVSNTGYVLQLANPYYEELTVRENLTLAAQIKLSNHYSMREKFQRVEQVMFVVRDDRLKYLQWRMLSSPCKG